MAESFEEKTLVLSEITSQLQDPREYVRLGALGGLIASGTKDPVLVKWVARCVDDPDPSVRKLAVLVLSQIGTPALGDLIRGLNEKQPTPVRIAASAGLGRIGPDAAAAADALCRCLESDDEILQWHASFALSKIGMPSLFCLLKMAKSSQEKIAVAALNSLEEMGGEAKMAVDEIRQLIPVSSPLVRLACHSALVKISGDPSSGLPMLLPFLDDKDPEILKACVERIGNLDELAKGAFPSLVKCLSDQSGSVRAAAALALARLGESGSPIVEGLTKLLGDSEVEARINAAIALGTMGSPAASALPALHKMEQSQEPRAAEIARAAIERIEKVSSSIQK